MGQWIKKHSLKFALVSGGVLSVLGVMLLAIFMFFYSENSCSPNQQNESSDIATAGMANGDWTKPGTESYKIAKQIWDRLHKDLGIDGAADAGVMGNIAHESGGFNLKAENGSGDGGHGLMQWTGNRRTALRNFAQQQGMDENSLELQIRMIENDMRNPAMWASGKYKDNSLKLFGHLTDPKEAASRFYISGLEAGQGWTHDPDGTEGKRQGYAETAYKVFGGENLSADDSLLGNAMSGATAGASAEESSENKCATNTDSGGDSDIISIAKKLLGYFHYGQVRPILDHVMSDKSSKDVSSVRKDGVTDCSGFVWLSCYLAGYKVPSGGWFTGSMWQDATGAHNWLQEVSDSDSKAGDVVIVGGPNSSGDGGHTAIIEEPWHGDATKVINENSSDDHVSEGTFKQEFGSMTSEPRLLARPIKDGGNK
ncbi:phage tail tip lysozyme [uncultured Limosilactobacillus sp.]|uniref:phage tail tip lysozyme n=1 Tax=uncultured Limosilactobacillus sp. TaxID=2837629 RepID=UPI0025E4AC92|nr:phage tail tip lysozyme [uncultured Limosilactobacillus sp.]